MIFHWFFLSLAPGFWSTGFLVLVVYCSGLDSNFTGSESLILLSWNNHCDWHYHIPLEETKLWLLLLSWILPPTDNWIYLKSLATFRCSLCSNSVEQTWSLSSPTVTAHTAWHPLPNPIIARKEAQKQSVVLSWKVISDLFHTTTL